MDIYQAALELRLCTFTNNNAGTSRDGGAISLWKATAKLSNCSLINNTAKVRRHGVLCMWSHCCSMLVKHKSAQRGGAINVFDASNVTLNSCILSNNVASVWNTFNAA